MEKANEHPVVAFLGLAASVLTIYAVVHGLSPDPVSRPLAEQYLVHYYSAVSSDPRKCCFDDLDSTYQSLHPGHTLTKYVAFFRRFNKIDVDHVRDAGNGYFKADVTYHHRDGQPPISEVDRFKLVCWDRSELPLVGCGVDDIKIDDVINKFH